MADRSFEALASCRLAIRRLAPSDADALAAYRSDETVARYQSWDVPFSVGSARQLIAAMDGVHPGTPGAWFQFAVCLAGPGPLIGDIGLHTMDGDERVGEIGFTIAAAYQGCGYAHESVTAVLEYAYRTLGMRQIVSRTDSRNVPAQRLLDRLGFSRKGTAEPVWFKGAWATDLCYRQKAANWSNRPIARTV
jgi:aminoglycoside 6'-N-acetyltransferase